MASEKRRKRGPLCRGHEVKVVMLPPVPRMNRAASIRMEEGKRRVRHPVYPFTPIMVRPHLRSYYRGEANNRTASIQAGPSFYRRFDKDIQVNIKYRKKPEPQSAATKSVRPAEESRETDISSKSSEHKSISITDEEISDVKKKRITVSKSVKINVPVDPTEIEPVKMTERERSLKMDMIRTLEEMVMEKKKELSETRERMRSSLVEEMELNRKLEELTRRTRALREMGALPFVSFDKQTQVSVIKKTPAASKT